ncbi:hypothetical protein M378DRAFT_12699 [Amanita muscaria Koide BX008]|uniref:Uncharacterized protein n=1 Tax=Amanita muscaria (strain Koide BX008) TaxID=946122 RepID=A0A0C2X0H5_AMAMK|nr:hypothetical protein M378DRAFT_12699 [Amanita muscaria Koide BX008]
MLANNGGESQLLGYGAQKFPVDVKPAQLNLFSTAPRSRNPVARHLQAGSAMPNPMGQPYPGYVAHMPPYVPAPYPAHIMPPGQWGSAPMPLQPSHVPNAMNVTMPSNALADQSIKLKNSDYPTITKWLLYCDKHPDREGDDLSQLIPIFEEEGYRRINQLTGDNISVEKLSNWLGIKKGTADLVLRHAVEDIALLKAGLLKMDDI